MIKITPVIAHARFFDDGCSYENRDKYTAIVTIQYISADTVYLSGAKGQLNKKQLLLLAEQLRNMGIKYRVAERHGKVIIKPI